MKKTIKKNICLLVSTVFIFSATPAFSVNAETPVQIQTKIQAATEMADELKKLGLFNGTEKGYELDKNATRAESIVMLIHLLGEEGNLSSGVHVFNGFDDVPSWAARSVNYAYYMKYAYGVGRFHFGSNDKITAAQYITLVLRALGYDGNRDGYTWDNPFAFAESIGLIEKGEYKSNSEFNRADMVIISYKALDTRYNNDTKTLREKLESNDVLVIDPWDGDKREAGKFNTPDDKLIVVNKDINNWINMDFLNNMIGRTYEFVYRPEMTQYGWAKVGGEFLYDSKTNRYGLQISHWRQSYDSLINENEMLNAFLETFYFECGSKKVSYALWSFLDSSAINNHANSDDFGFTDVGYFENGGTITMDGIYIDVSNVDGVVTVMFH